MNMQNKLDLSNEVSDVMNGKKHLFAAEFIIPLKKKLFRQAIEKDEHILPCGHNHFHVNMIDNELLFWYNSLKDQTTKITKIRIES